METIDHATPLEPSQEIANDGQRDLEKAVDELAERLPAPLVPLARLAYNYRWTWIAGAPSLFKRIDPLHWRRGGFNPRYVIEAVPPRRLHELARDNDFVERLHGLADELFADLRRPWARTPVTPNRPVAYFCSEYGIHSSLPIYAGGLGVLAGDTIKAASDLALPMVGVGLLYGQGYFHQHLDPGGWQHEYWVRTDFERLPAVLVTRGQEPLTVTVPIRGRDVFAQIWRIDVGRVPVYLLDTDLEDNEPIDRWITSRLYIGDRQTRLAQYAVLGIGGVRALRALGIEPGVVHLNEGHAVFGSFERMRESIERGHSFEEALAAVCEGAVFTTHTPIAAGNEGYHRDEIATALGAYFDQIGIDRSLVYGLGRIDPQNEHEAVSITPLALRTTRSANGVSRLHGGVSRGMWKALWPGCEEETVPIGHVTNGVHVLTWMASPMQRLLDRHLGSEWRARFADLGIWEAVAAIADEELWRVRCALRESLVERVREQSVLDRLARGETIEYVEAAARVFDPNVLTIGFARRVAMYKRLYLLSRLPEGGFMRFLADGPTPLQLVVAGKAHPQDHEAKVILRDGIQWKIEPLVGRRAVFLEDYDMSLAARIVAGVDVWLNLPRPPLEASGTSGMKVTLNGGLNVSVMDGWWAEAYDGHNGWAIQTPEADPHTQDEHDARALQHILEHEVIPLFYDRGPDGIPHRWLQRVKNAMRTLIPKFSAERMLREYVATMYAGSYR